MSGSHATWVARPGAPLLFFSPPAQVRAGGLAEGGSEEGALLPCGSAVPGEIDPEAMERPEDEGEGGAAASSCSSSCGVDGCSCSEEERLEGAWYGLGFLRSRPQAWKMMGMAAGWRMGYGIKGERSFKEAWGLAWNGLVGGYLGPGLYNNKAGRDIGGVEICIRRW
jgi:hypothetical protein